MHDSGSIFPEFILKTNASISSINITTLKIVYIIKKYTTNNANGFDDLSVAMLQFYACEIAKPLHNV